MTAQHDAVTIDVDVAELDRRIAAIVGKGNGTALFIVDMVTSEVNGLDLTLEFERVTRFLGEGKKVATLVQLLFVRYLANRDLQRADIALQQMDLLRDLAGDTPTARQGERDLVGDIDNA